MKFLVYKTKQDRNKRLSTYGSIEASCIDVASDLLLKKLRKTPGPKNGDVFLVIQDTGKPLAEDFVKNGSCFRLLHYREIE